MHPRPCNLRRQIHSHPHPWLAIENVGFLCNSLLEGEVLYIASCATMDSLQSINEGLLNWYQLTESYS